jgi:hypothetical protein
MVTNLSLDFTEEQRRQVAGLLGQRGVATRKDITRWVLGLVEAALQHGQEELPAARLDTPPPPAGCTTLDHVYLLTTHGAPCLCGRSHWGMR